MRRFLVVLASIAMIAALAAAGPASAEQKPLTKPAPTKPLWEDHFAVKNSKGDAKGGISAEDDRAPLGSRKGGAKPGTK